MDGFAEINKLCYWYVVWFLDHNCFVPTYLSREPNVIKLAYVFVVSLSKYISGHCTSDVSVRLVLGIHILDTLLSESTQWLIWSLFAEDFWSKLIYFQLSFSPQPFRNRYLCFCFAKKPRETFLYKIDVLGLIGLIVDSFDVWWESGWLRE